MDQTGSSLIGFEQLREAARPEGQPTTGQRTERRSHDSSHLQSGQVYQEPLYQQQQQQQQQQFQQQPLHPPHPPHQQGLPIPQTQQQRRQRRQRQRHQDLQEYQAVMVRRQQRMLQRLRQQGQPILPQELQHALQGEHREAQWQFQQALRLRQQEELQRSQQILQREHQEDVQLFQQMLQREELNHQRRLMQDYQQQQHRLRQQQQRQEQHLRQQQPRIETRPRTRPLNPAHHGNILELFAPQRYTPIARPTTRQEQLQTAQSQQQQQGSQQARVETAPSLWPLGPTPDGNAPSRSIRTQVSARANISTPPSSSLIETMRPSSVPAVNTSAAPPPPRNPPKRSNILDILNDEPAEPPRQSLSNPAPSEPGESDIISEPTYENQDEAGETGLGEYSHGISSAGEKPAMDQYHGNVEHEHPEAPKDLDDAGPSKGNP